MRASGLNSPIPLLLMAGLMAQVVSSFSPPKALGPPALHAHDYPRPLRASPSRAPLLCPHGVRHQLKLTALLSGMSHFEQNNFEIAFEADGKVLDDGGRDEGDESLCLLEREILFETHEEKKSLERLLNEVSARDARWMHDSNGGQARMKKFVRRFAEMLRKAGYRPLSERDVAISEAMSAQGVLRSDIVTDESSFLRLLARNDSHAYISPRILVWRRGVAVEEVSGGLYLQKLDYLQSSILLALWRSALQAVRGVWEEMEVARSMLRDGSSTLVDDVRTIMGMSAPDKVKDTLGGTLSSAEQTFLQLAVKLLERWGLVSSPATRPLSDFHPCLMSPPSCYDVVRFVGLAEGIQNAYEGAVDAVGNQGGLKAFLSAFLRPVYIEDPIFESIVVMYARKQREEQSYRVGVLPFLVYFVRLLSLHAIDPKLPFLSDRPLVPGRTGRIHVKESLHDSHVYTEYSIDVKDVRSSSCLRLLIAMLYRFRPASKSIEFKIPVNEPFALVSVARSRINIVMLNSKREEMKVSQEQEATLELELIGYQSVNIQNIKSIWPDRQLQFRPLDSLRLDLVTFTTLASVLAQIKLDNPYTDAAALVTTTAWILGAIFRFNARRNAYELQSSRGLARRITARGLNVIRMAGDKAFLQHITKARLVYDSIRSAGPQDLASIASMCEDRLKAKHPACGTKMDEDEILSLLKDLQRRSLVEECHGKWQMSELV